MLEPCCPTAKSFLSTIDHPPATTTLGTVNIGDAGNTSTCFILYLYLGSYGWDITPNMATAMLHGFTMTPAPLCIQHRCPNFCRHCRTTQGSWAESTSAVLKNFCTSIPRLRLYRVEGWSAEFNEKVPCDRTNLKRLSELSRTEAPMRLVGVDLLTHVQEKRLIAFYLPRIKQAKSKPPCEPIEDLDLSAILLRDFGGGGHHQSRITIYPAT